MLNHRNKQSPVKRHRYADVDVTGRFVIIDGYDIWGGGIIMEPLKDEQEQFRREARLRDFQWRRGEVQLSERIQRNGHNAGIISEPGHAGRTFQLSTRLVGAPYVDPDRWIEQTPTREGSWWPSWERWLVERSGPRRVLPPLGDAAHGYGALDDAPGEYVLQR